MNAPVEPLMTAEEFATQNRDNLELVRGRMQPTHPTGGRVGFICANVCFEFANAIEHSRTWVACSNDTFVLTGRDPDSVRGGDLVIWRRDAIPKPMPDLILTPPEIVVEVRGPLDSIAEMLCKATEYVTAGVKVVLVLDPDHKTAGLFSADQLPRRFGPSDALTLPDVLPGFSVEVKKFFE
ncbi:MAG: hypothetical protein C0467_02470 [Planctomycetaceae bacterium]|nr:hypothetical protein [Planctomycetaceae bacterium]